MAPAKALLLQVIVLLGISQAQTILSQAKLPTNVSSLAPGTVAWSNPTNAELLDGNFAATNNINPGSSSQRLYSIGYGFSVPGNASVVGIAVITTHTSSAVGVQDLENYLCFNGNITGNQWCSVNNQSCTTNWNNGAATANVTYGGIASLWGGAWTPVQVNDPSFGYSLRVKNANAAGGGIKASVDAFLITVFYTLPVVSTAAVTTGALSTAAISTGARSTAAVSTGVVTTNSPQTTEAVSTGAATTEALSTGLQTSTAASTTAVSTAAGSTTATPATTGSAASSASAPATTGGSTTSQFASTTAEGTTAESTIGEGTTGEGTTGEGTTGEGQVTTEAATTGQAGGRPTTAESAAPLSAAHGLVCSLALIGGLGFLAVII